MIALTFLAVLPQPVFLDRIGLASARQHNGKIVVASFIVAKPSYTLRGFTMLGANDQPDGVERGAMLRGNWLHVEMGKRFTVLGRFRVIDHPARYVNQQIIPPWSEIRIEQ